MSSLRELAKQKLAEQKAEVKPKEKPEVQIIPEVKKPKTIVKKEVLGTIDFSNLADSSDFKRLIYLAITGKSFRGSNIKLEEELKQKLKGGK